MNALQELLHFTKDKEDIKCAIVKYDKYDDGPILALLPVDFTQKQAHDFYATLNTINYDAGYGSQQLYGTIWFTDNTWATRREYDGSEWWYCHKYPDIQKEFTNVNA